MTTCYQLIHAAEIYATDGPTGNWAEVTRGEIQDYGGNVLFAGNADECVAEQRSYRIPTRRVPTEWKRFAGEVGGADNLWQLVIG